MSVMAVKRLVAVALYVGAAATLILYSSGSFAAEPAKAADVPVAEAAPAPPQAEEAAPAKPTPPSPAPAAQEPAAEKVPPLEEFLTRAMANHPDIVAARAKVELAEAELRQVEQRVANELAELQSNWAFAAANLPLITEQARRGQLSAAGMIEARAKLAQIESRAKMLLNQKPSVKHEAPSEESPAKLEPPKGPVIGKLREVLSKTTTIEFSELPLEEVMKYLADLHSINIRVDVRQLEEEGIPPDMPVTVKAENIPLGAALQAIEDATNLRFGVRNYGIICTTQEGAAGADRSALAVKLWEDSLKEPPAAK